MSDETPVAWPADAVPRTRALEAMLRHVPALTDPAPPMTPLEPVLPLVEAGPIPMHDSERVVLDPVHAILDYRDRAGAFSRRRITMRYLSGLSGLARPSRRGMPILWAWCHERKACRPFRWDGIEGIVDRDGVVHGPDAFFASTFALRPGDSVPMGTARALRDRLRAPLVLLAAVARRRERIRSRGAAAIQRYVRQDLGGTDSPWASAVAQSVAITVPLLRPTRDLLPGAIRGAARLDPAARHRLHLAMRRLAGVEVPRGDRHLAAATALTGALGRSDAVDAAGAA